MKENEKTTIDSTVAAAIAMALSTYCGDNVHDEESGILTITYVNKYWNNML